MDINADEIDLDEQSLATELSVQIVCSYVSHNAISSSDLPEFIKTIHSTVTELSSPLDNQEPDKLPRPDKPAVKIKKSLSDEYIICLEDGLKFKSLKRHLKAKYDLTPEEYRARWGLPSDYPMVAPAYARKRSELAKTIGLGRARKGN